MDSSVLPFSRLLKLSSLVRLPDATLTATPSAVRVSYSSATFAACSVQADTPAPMCCARRAAAGESGDGTVEVIGGIGPKTMEKTAKKRGTRIERVRERASR